MLPFYFIILPCALFTPARFGVSEKKRRSLTGLLKLSKKRVDGVLQHSFLLRQGLLLERDRKAPKLAIIVDI